MEKEIAIKEFEAQTLHFEGIILEDAKKKMEAAEKHKAAMAGSQKSEAERKLLSTTTMMRPTEISIESLKKSIEKMIEDGVDESDSKLQKSKKELAEKEQKLVEQQEEITKLQAIVEEEKQKKAIEAEEAKKPDEEAAEIDVEDPFKFMKEGLLSTASAFKYIVMDMMEKDEQFAELVMLPHKSYSRMFRYICKEASKYAFSMPKTTEKGMPLKDYQMGMFVGTDDFGYKMVEQYYRLDDKKEVEDEIAAEKEYIEKCEKQRAEREAREKAQKALEAKAKKQATEEVDALLLEDEAYLALDEEAKAEKRKKLIQDKYLALKQKAEIALKAKEKREEKKKKAAEEAKLKEAEKELTSEEKSESDACKAEATSFNMNESCEAETSDNTDVESSEEAEEKVLEVNNVEEPEEDLEEKKRRQEELTRLALSANDEQMTIWDFFK